MVSNSTVADGNGGGGSGQRVVREIGGLVNWSLLTKMNYTEWALIMKIKMHARNLCVAIEPGGVSCRRTGWRRMLSPVLCHRRWWRR
jgi:hypothetical protein